MIIALSLLSFIFRLTVQNDQAWVAFISSSDEIDIKSITLEKKGHRMGLTDMMGLLTAGI